ncbi:NAD(P)/FAD-dependent oxidoreductase [Frankia gtarii]|uniref:NAD(P)/FAD-dependent oxidoreductase n=1 Tax=Frankia gtarii TaxID=2950102 RepID=UPI0021BE0B5A|nr:FAD-dependent monooxygenase [Frankia gtarii]
MVSTGLNHAVVIGSSFAGITAARVLSDHFARVTVVERDELTDESAVRRGVPQGSHVHGILKLGREILDDLFPGFVEETQREGAVFIDQIANGAGWTPHGWSIARGPTSLKGYGVRRPLLELVARRRLFALPRVELVQGRVQGLRAAGGRVCGVVLDGADDGSRTLDADFVVDASGRGSVAPGWLEEAGFEVPTDTVVNAFGGYASRLIRVPDVWPDGVRFAAALPAPGATKGAIVYPQDNGLYIVSLFGLSRDYPPGNEEGFDAFLRGCRIPLMHTIVSQSEKVNAIRTSRSTANRWRHYEKLADPPVGFVAVGDAALAANPMYGQGISTACLGAVTLGQTIVDADGDLAKVPRDFFARQATNNVFPWELAIGYDLRFPDTVGQRPTPTPELLERGRYLDTLSQVATEDLEVSEALLLSTHIYDRSRLFEPDFVAKVEAWRAAGRRPRFTDPTRPPWEAAA